MTVRDDLLRACARGDQLTLRRTGWQPVWEALRTWWPKAFASDDLRAYVSLLADEDPSRIVTALERWTKTKRGQFRPSPAEIAHELRTEDTSDQRNPGLSRDPAAKPQALAAAARAHRDGEPECSCGYHRAQWRIDSAGVLRCVECSGLEPGQLFAAEDAESEAA